MLSIIVKDVHVEFPVYDHRSRSLKYALGLEQIAKGLTRVARNPNVGGQIGTGESGRIVIKALDGVSFEIHEGDRIGLLGHNGSGKTTLLRTLSGIYEPVRGAIWTNGRVFPLFNLQLGMDQDATGAENIWMRGKMLGLTNQQIKGALADIAEFTELGEFLQMPTRTYSMGMMLRLAFAISTAITPEILVLDEMIGAGDATFFARAEARLKTFLAKAGILVLASHRMPMLRHWCNKGLLLQQGKLIGCGPIEEVIGRYEEMTGSAPSSDIAIDADDAEGFPTTPVKRLAAPPEKVAKT